MAAEETSSMSAYNSSLRGKAEICISSRNYATGWEDQHADSRSHIPTVCPCNCPNNSHLCAGKKTWCAFATYSTQTQHAQLLKCWVVFITHRKAAVNHAQKKEKEGPPRRTTNAEYQKKRIRQDGMLWYPHRFVPRPSASCLIAEISDWSAGEQLL